MFNLGRRAVDLDPNSMPFWISCIRDLEKMLAHAKERVLLHKAVIQQDLKVVSQGQNKIKLLRGQFIVILYTISDKPL